MAYKITPYLTTIPEAAYTNEYNRWLKRFQTKYGADPSRQKINEWRMQPALNAPSYQAWYKGHMARHGNVTTTAAQAWLNDWMKKGGATPPTEMNLTPASANMQEWMKPKFQQYSNLYWQSPSQDLMNKWTTQQWANKPRRPWSMATTGVAGREGLVTGRQNRPWTFY
jgi:hypothetical protein